MEIKTFVIVGGGVFGAATALHLARTRPRCRVVLLEQNAAGVDAGASRDVNKIIRIEYDDPVYLRLALRAERAWREDPLFARFYHAAEKVTVGELELQRRILALLRKLHAGPHAGFVPVPDLRRRYAGLLDDMAFHALDETYVNPASGWAEGVPALAAVVASAVALGVEPVEAAVSRILFDEAGHCAGVRTADGRTYAADHIILATGAQTARLLADSAPARLDFRVENRLLAAGCVSCLVKLSAEQAVEFARLPITVHDVGEIYGEVLPPTPDNYLKFASETSFKNSVYHPASGQMVSVPTDVDSVPQSLRDECRIICNDIFGRRGHALEIDSFRLCWDAFAADGDFFISPHPNSNGLYFATGGSFHAWKFFPVLGELVGAMLDGTLDETLRAKWAWDRKMGDDGGVDKSPAREWRDIVVEGVATKTRANGVDGMANGGGKDAGRRKSVEAGPPAGFCGI